MKIFSGGPRALVVAACMALLTGWPSAALAHSDHGPCQDCMSAEEFRLADVRHFFPAVLGQSWSYIGYGQEFAGFKRTVTQTKDGRVQVEDVNGGAQTARVFSVTEEALVQQLVLSESEAAGDLLSAKPNQAVQLRKGPLQHGATWEDTSSAAGAASGAGSASGSGSSGTVFESLMFRKAPRARYRSSWLRTASPT